ncbi:MAG: hypothetical protein OXH83_14560 [Bryobacterales bacterium]|nr:hypothetical protein [Bryobacterales bacterium]
MREKPGRLAVAAESDRPEVLSVVGAVRAYQDLWWVGATLRPLKDLLELRPVWPGSIGGCAPMLVAALGAKLEAPQPLEGVERTVH